MCSQAETTVYSRQREAQTGLHISTASPPHADTAPLGFPAPPPPRGPGPKGPKNRGRESAGRRSHAAPRAGRHHVAPAAEECREGGPRTHTRAHAHSRPRLRPAPAFPSTPRVAAGAERTGRAAASSQRAGGAWRPTVTRPPGPATPSSRPACTASPLARLAFSARPLTGFPVRWPSGSLSRRKVPGIAEGKPRLQ